MERWVPTLTPEAQRAPRGKGELATTQSVAPRFSQVLCPKRHLPWKASGGRGSGHPSRNLDEQMAMTSHHQRLTPCSLRISKRLQVKKPKRVSLNLMSEPSLLITMPFWSWWFKVYPNNLYRKERNNQNIRECVYSHTHTHIPSISI